MTEPDWDALQAVNAEIRRLHSKGELTQAEFDRLFKEAVKAVGEHSRFLEGTMMLGIEYGLE